MRYLQKEKRFMLRGDLHIHSDRSDGDVLSKDMVRAVNSGFDFAAISDHDTLSGSIAAQEMVGALALPFVVIPGCEITGPGCHLLAFGVTKDISSIGSVSDICRR